jgi:hypothetical protein
MTPSSWNLPCCRSLDWELTQFVMLACRMRLALGANVRSIQLFLLFTVVFRAWPGMSARMPVPWRGASLQVVRAPHLGRIASFFGSVSVDRTESVDQADQAG